MSDTTSASAAPATTTMTADNKTSDPRLPRACESMPPRSNAVKKTDISGPSGSVHDAEASKPTAGKQAEVETSVTSDFVPSTSAPVTAVASAESEPNLNKESNAPLYTQAEPTPAHTSSTEKPPEAAQQSHHPARSSAKQASRVNSTHGAQHSPSLDQRRTAEDHRPQFWAPPYPGPNTAGPFVSPPYPHQFFPGPHPGDFLPRPNWTAPRPGLHELHYNFAPMPHPAGHVSHPLPIPSFPPYSMQGSTAPSVVGSVTPRQIRSGPRNITLPVAMDRIPPTGYELLTAKLCGVGDGAPVSPLYRRFAGLQHRILLGLQDDLSSLEEQLQKLDAADSRKRLFPDGYAPASRRHEFFEPDELSTRRGMLLDDISYKLYQYTSQLESWKKTAGFAEPTAAEIHHYKTYLENMCPIVPTEAKFLEAEDDLIVLDKPQSYEDCLATDRKTMSGRSRSSSSTLYSPTGSVGETFAKTRRHERKARIAEPPNVKVLLLGFGGAIVFPTVTFPFIPIFMGRMAIVFFSGLAVLVTFIQTGTVNLLQDGNLSDAALLAAVYGIVMAFVAGTSN